MFYVETSYGNGAVSGLLSCGLAPKKLMVVSYPTNTSAWSGSPRSIEGHSPRKNALTPSTLPQNSRKFPGIDKETNQGIRDKGIKIVNKGYE